MSDPVTVTIHGHPSRDVMLTLVDLAMREGLGLAVQPRTKPIPMTALPAPKVRITKPRQSNGKANRKMSETTSAHVAAAVANTRPYPARLAAAAGRRDAVIGQLRRVGDRGLSFKGLLDAMRSHLVDAGTQEQQVHALRNALTILQGEGRVHRVAGQWLARETE